MATQIIGMREYGQNNIVPRMTISESIERYVSQTDLLKRRISSNVELKAEDAFDANLDFRFSGIPKVETRLMYDRTGKNYVVTVLIERSRIFNVLT